MGGYRRRLLVSAVVVVGLFLPAAPMATAGSGSGRVVTAPAAKTPIPETITGIVQTFIKEQPRGRQHRDGSDRTKVLRVGTKLVPLTEGSLTTTTDGTAVSVTAVPAVDGTKEVLSSRTISAAAGPAEVAAAAAAIPSVHQVYVALVRPKGLNLPTTTEAAARQMVDRVSSFWASQTDNQVSFATAKVLPLYQSNHECDGTSSASTYDMWDEARDLMPEAYGPGKHLVLVAPDGADESGCAYGLGSVGAVGATNNTVFVSGLSQSALAHELGHNLGLHHSNSLRCSGAQDMPMVNRGFPGCQATEYDDAFDVMGISGPGLGVGNLNAVHLDGMNLLPNAVRKITPTTSVTTARITPLSAPLSTTTTNRTLKVTDPGGASYFVEYRTYSGRDMGAVDSYYKASWGVRVLRGDPAAPAGAGSYELDATPTSASYDDYNRVIPVGGTFTAASGELAITVTAQDADGATVSISVPTPPKVAPPKVAPPKVAPVTRISDFNNDGRTDMIGRDKAGRLLLYPGNGSGELLPRRIMGASGWNAMTAIITPGDVNGDGKGDLLARTKAGQLWFYPGNGAGGLGTRRLAGRSGWNSMTALVAAGNMIGSSHPDMLARDKAGRLWLYPSTGAGTFGRRHLAGVSGWNSMTAFSGAGDLTGDGRADLLARDKAGNLWIYRGNSAARLGARTLSARGWNGMTALVTPGNLDRVSGNDLVARDGAGKLWFYPGNNAGHFIARRPLGYGYNGYTIA